MKPQDIFGKYTNYFALMYAFLKIFFEHEQGAGNIQPSDELQKTSPMVQKDIVRSGETRNQSRHAGSRKVQQPVRDESPEYEEELHRNN